jgi:hypothetical protein
MRTAFASLDDEKRALEEVRMDLARTIPRSGRCCASGTPSASTTSR